MKTDLCDYSESDRGYDYFGQVMGYEMLRIVMIGFFKLKLYFGGLLPLYIII